MLPDGGPLADTKAIKSPPVRFVRDGRACAAAMVGAIGEGERVCGVTGGQFSLIELIDVLLDQSGPADVVVATWTAGVRDIELAKETQVDGRIKAMRWIVDRSFVSRQPKYAARLIELYGAGAVRVTRTHAKFVLIDGPSRKFVVQTSMNLNKNKRIESFDVTEGGDLLDHYRAICEDIERDAAPGVADGPSATRVMESVMGGEAVPDDRRDRVAEMLCGGVSVMDAAKRAGVASSTVELWLTDPSFAKACGRADPASITVDQLGPVKYLSDQLVSIHDDIALARKQGSMPAVAALYKRAEECRKALDAARPPAATLEDMSEEEFMAGLRRAMEQWPDQYHELSAEIYADRYRRVR